MLDGNQGAGFIPENVATVDSAKGSKFETFFDAPYNELKTVLKDTIKPGQKAIDLGAYKGGLEDFMDTLDRPLAIECVDSDEQALRELEKKDFKNLQIVITPSDANDFIENYRGNA